MILLLSGSSSSGKNTVIKKLLENNKNIKYINSFTSREKRPNESNGNPYFFISKDEFQNKIKNNEFYEHEFIHNNFYGVEKAFCQNLLNQNYSLVKDMGVIGTFSLKEHLKDQFVETVFLYVNKRELKKRLKLRGDKKEDIKRRMKRFKFEKQNSLKYNFLIHNKNFNNTVSMLEKIISLNTPEFYNYIKLTNKIEKINLKKVVKYANKLTNNKLFKPIKVYFNEKEFYLKKDTEKYLASLISKTNVTKKLVFKKVKVKQTEKQENVIAFIEEYKMI